MDSFFKYDRVILIKELNEKIKKVGDVFEIANIMDNTFLLRDSKTRVALGVVSFEDFEKHFVHEPNFKGWTQWCPITGFDNQTDCFYKTNRKKVIVKFLKDNIKAEACCNKMDDFNLAFGVQIAYLRCLNKAMTKQKTECEEKIKALDHDIAGNNNSIQKMIDSLV